MNTPAHAVVNLLALGRREHPELVGAIVVGGLFPDLPIVLFYAWEKLRGTPEGAIWGSAYHSPGWQLLFDTVHSIPLAAATALVAWRLGALRSAAFAASVGLHSLLDLPLHHDDAHRHFFPLSDWRFESPVSYWDPAHHGLVASAMEVAVVLVGCAVLARRFPRRRLRWMLGLVAGIYVVYWAYVLVFWV